MGPLTGYGSMRLSGREWHETLRFRKKNSRGQPVMKHRVDKILEALQKETGGA